MDSSSGELEPVELLADEFVERQRRGEQPSLDEYVDRYPELASEIREVFPALAMIEQVAPASADLNPSHGTVESQSHVLLEKVGDYRILREIGRGGMGVVYEAEQESLRRRVALKLLPRQHAADAKSLERFQREARAAARMHHTNIVPVFEVGQDAEHIFYAMQLIQGQGLNVVIDDLQRLHSLHSNGGQSSRFEGAEPGGDKPEVQSLAASLVAGRFQQENLADAINADAPARHSSQKVITSDAEALRAYAETVVHASGSTASAVLPGQSELSTAETNRSAYFRSVAQLGLQTAEALSYAHARGIIHRDIKPSNLLLDGAGVVWVTDFGLAKTSEESMTGTGDILGTIRYMSPERFSGQCDVRADVYSLGLTLYEMLVLKPAFDSPDRLKLIDMVSKTDPVSPRTIEPRIPRDLETIVLKCSDKDPKHRYQSADELVDDLRRFVDDEPIRARRISVLERFARWSRRNKSLAISLSVVALLVLILAIGSTLTAGHFRNLARTNADLADEKSALVDEKQTALLRESRQRKEMETTLYHSLVNEANALRLARKPGYRPLAWSRLNQAMAINTPEKDTIRIRQEAVACMGDFVANDAIVWKGLNNFTRKMALFPDSRHVALVEEATDEKGGKGLFAISIRTIPANRETSKFRIELPGKIGDLVITPDGRHLVICNHSGLVVVWKRNGAGKWERINRHEPPPLFRPSGIVRLRIFPDGDHYLLCRFTGRVLTIRGLNDPKLDKSIPAPDGESFGIPSISPDGRFVAAPLISSKTIGIWNVDTGKLERQVTTPFTSLFETAYTPNGRFLICGADDGFAMYDVKTFQQWSLVRLDAVRSPSITPDSQVLAFSTLARRIRLWNLNSQHEIAVIDHVVKQSFDPLGITPDGRWLISAGKNELRFWRLRGLAEKLTLAGHHEMVPCNAFSRDGKLLATGSKDRTVRLWDAQTGALLHTFSPGYLPQSIAFSQDDRLMAVGSQYGEVSEPHLTLWNLKSRRRVAAQTTPGRSARGVAFTSDGRQLIAAGHGLTVFDIVRNSTGKNAVEQIELKQCDFVTGSGSQRLVISSDNKTVVWNDGRYSLRVWDLKERQEREVFPKNLLFEGWHNLSLLPDDRHVVFIARNGQPQVWDSKTGKMAYEISAAAQFQSYHIALSPDGRWLAGDATAEALTIIDVKAKQPLFTLPSERSPIKSVSWSPDSNRIAVGLSDGGVAIWNIKSIKEQLTKIDLGWK